MATAQITTHLEASRLLRLGPELRRRVDQAVRKGAFDCEAEAERRAPVKTGALRASHYVVTAERSGFAQSVSAARGLRPDAPLADPITLGAFTAGEIAALLAVGVGYGFDVHFGTRRMRGRPWLFEASEAVRSAFVAALGQVLRGVA